MYLKKKKEMPGLTPAAWRKAAAQEMGLDYDTFLAIWKLNKGAKKKAKMVPESAPTKIASESSSPTMGIPMKKVSKKAVLGKKTAAKPKFADVKTTPTSPGVVETLLKGKFKKGNNEDTVGWHSITKDPGSDQVVVTWGKGNQFVTSELEEALIQVQEAMHIMESLGYVVAKAPYSAWKFHVKGKKTLDIVDPAEELAEAATKQLDDLFDSIDGLVNQTEKGLFTHEDLHDILGDTLTEAKAIKGLTPNQLGAITQKIDFVKKDFPVSATAKVTDDAMDLATINKDVDELIDAYKKGLVDDDQIQEAFDFMPAEYPGVTKATIAKKIEEVKDAVKAIKEAKIADDLIKTPYGPLDHDLAQSVYKKMKKEMPGATPATLRHAAAEYLGVDYNDYLKAWKKPGTAAAKAKQTPASKMPPQKDITVSASSQGKYSNQAINADQLKDELATLYGPSANKSYINLVYDDFDGSFSVQFPNSLLPTQAAKDAVVKGLQNLGLKVTKGHAGHYKIKSPYAQKIQASNAKSIKTSGTYTSPDGKVLWDFQKANEWSEGWWRTLTSTQQAAVRKYTGSGYHSMNGALRKGATPDATSRALSSAMRPVDHEFTVFRGTRIPISQFQQGGLWSDKGFMSTAINPAGSWDGIKFEIVIPKGTKGAYVDPFSSHRGENEFIIDKGTKFRVIEVDTRGSGRVKMVAIPHK